MSRSEVTEEQIREIARRIGEQPGVVQVWLFGSHATGTAGQDSDVDLLAIGRDEFERTRGTVGALANFVAREGRVVHERAFAGRSG